VDGLRQQIDKAVAYPGPTVREAVRGARADRRMFAPCPIGRRLSAPGLMAAREKPDSGTNPVSRGIRLPDASDCPAHPVAGRTRLPKPSGVMTDPV